MASGKPSRKVRVLPSGWERCVDKSTNTQPYYIDHNTETTHWTPPPPSHALPPPPQNSNSPIQRMKPPKIRHRRSSTLDDVFSLKPKTSTIYLLSSKSLRQPPITPPPPSIPRHTRNKSRSFSNTTDNLYQRKPTAPPNHLKTKPSKRVRKQRHGRRPFKPPPPYIPVTNIPPPPPPRRLPALPNHSAPTTTEYKAITDLIIPYHHPLHRTVSVTDVTDHSRVPLPPSPPEEDEPKDITNEEALPWLQVNSVSETTLQGIRGRERSIAKIAQFNLSKRPSKRILALSLDVDALIPKPTKKHLKKPGTPDITGKRSKYRSNTIDIWGRKKSALKNSIKRIRKTLEIYDDDDVKMEEDEKHVDIIEFYTLDEIVARVTSPQLRGTQEQTVLLYTYSIYSSKKELLKSILDRLSSSLEDNRIQIKVLSLLKTWLKTENDFRECLEEVETAKERSISPIPSVPAPPLIESDDNKDNVSASVNDGELIPPVLKRESQKISSPKAVSFAEYFQSQFISITSSSVLLQKLSAPILSQLSTNKKDSNTKRDRTLSFADAPTPKIPSLKVKSSMVLDLLMMDPTEVARQICLLEYDIFKRIKFEEFLKEKSQKEKKMERENIEEIVSSMNVSQHNLSEEQLQSHAKLKENIATNTIESFHPNIDAMTDWFNRLVVWTQIEILYQRDHNKRCKTLCSLLKICDALEQYNNISSLCAVRAGLCSAPIHRLRKTWHSISKKHKEIKAKIDELFKLGNGQKNLRDRVAIISQPAIPHLGLFLGDIVFIHDGNHTFNKDDNNKINWSKMKLLHDRMHWIYMFQQSPFIFLSVPIIKNYLHSKMKILSEDFLYKLSREVEPPEKKK